MSQNEVITERRTADYFRISAVKWVGPTFGQKIGKEVKVHVAVTPNTDDESWSVFSDDGKGNGDWLYSHRSAHWAWVWAINWLNEQVSPSR